MTYNIKPGILDKLRTKHRKELQQSTLFTRLHTSDIGYKRLYLEADKCICGYITYAFPHQKNYTVDEHLYTYLPNNNCQHQALIYQVLNQQPPAPKQKPGPKRLGPSLEELNELKQIQATCQTSKQAFKKEMQEAKEQEDCEPSSKPNPKYYETMGMTKKEFEQIQAKEEAKKERHRISAKKARAKKKAEQPGIGHPERFSSQGW